LLHTRRRESNERGNLQSRTAKWRNLSERAHRFTEERDSFGKKTSVKTIGAELDQTPNINR
jgi:hypothetical protein